MRYETIISELKECKACILKRKGWQKRGMVPIVELVLARRLGLLAMPGRRGSSRIAGPTLHHSQAS